MSTMLYKKSEKGDLKIRLQSDGDKIAFSTSTVPDELVEKKLAEGWFLSPQEAAKPAASPAAKSTTKK